METRVLPFNDDSIAEAARLILAGEPVAVPTETVYGLAADATNAEAVARIYEAKGRPSFNPLIVHVPDLAAAERIGEFDDEARALAEQHWPGPLTLVVPLRDDAGIASIVTAGPADHRPARAGASGDAGAAPRGRPPARRAFGQCQRLDQPDPGRACAEEPRRPHSADHRRRRRPSAGLNRPSSPRPAGRCACFARARSQIDAERRRPATRSKRRASSRAIMRRRSRCGSNATRRQPTNI